MHLLNYFKIATNFYSRVIVCQTIRNMRVVPIPANEDNYQYLIIDEHTNDAAIVDPVDVELVIFTFIIFKKNTLFRFYQKLKITIAN